MTDIVLINVFTGFNRQYDILGFCHWNSVDIVSRTFAKFGKANIGAVKSVRLYVRMEKLGSNWAEFLFLKNHVICKIMWKNIVQ